MAEKKWHCVNLRLLPIKAHFFFFFGAMGGVMPFMPVLAKNLGISATAVGLVYTVLPFCVFFSKPLFGYITDFFQNIKLIVFTLVVVTSVGYMSVLFIPAIDDTPWTSVQIQCQYNGTSMSVLPFEYDKNCLRDSLKNGANAELQFTLCENNSSTSLEGKIAYVIPANASTVKLNDTMWLEFNPKSNFTCECVKNGTSIMKSSSINSCLQHQDDFSVYKTYQFWLFTLAAVISGTGAATVFCLSDAACYEVLGDRNDLYGRQRMFATISWGCATLLAGFFNDLITGTSEINSFSAGFYLMLALNCFDIFLLLKIKLTKAKMSLSICKDIGKIFSSCETVAFAGAVYIIGGLTGLIWNYQFWFLEDLGASQLLMGLCVAVQCLAAEMPFFFFAGWFIKTFGYFNCVIGSFVAFTLRLGLYYILVNPWMILPIEMLHGVTFAVFYASMTGYASHSAPPGTEATMMGILGGLFEGLGVATGSLLGGVGFDRLGSRQTFLVAATISMVCAPTLAIIQWVLRRLRK